MFFLTNVLQDACKNRLLSRKKSELLRDKSLCISVEYWLGPLMATWPVWSSLKSSESESGWTSFGDPRLRPAPLILHQSPHSRVSPNVPGIQRSNRTTGKYLLNRQQDAQQKSSKFIAHTPTHTHTFLALCTVATVLHSTTVVITLYVKWQEQDVGLNFSFLSPPPNEDTILFSGVVFATKTHSCVYVTLKCTLFVWWILLWCGGVYVDDWRFILFLFLVCQPQDYIRSWEGSRHAWICT